MNIKAIVTASKPLLTPIEITLIIYIKYLESCDKPCKLNLYGVQLKMPILMMFRHYDFQVQRPGLEYRRLSCALKLGPLNYKLKSSLNSLCKLPLFPTSLLPRLPAYIFTPLLQKQDALNAISELLQALRKRVST